MKTITEYQPLIYSALFSESERRRTRQHRLSRFLSAAMLPFYFVASLSIMAGTGFAAWNWQFWVMFLPIFAVGERLLRVMAPR